MFSRLAKLRKSDDYEDLDGADRVEMDITDPAMRRYAGLGEPEPAITETVQPQEEPPDGKAHKYCNNKLLFIGCWCNILPSVTCCSPLWFRAMGQDSFRWMCFPICNQEEMLSKWPFISEKL